MPFEVDAETDTLRVSGALDFETQAEYTLAVTASDDIGGSSETNVTVTVTNVDEPGLVEIAPMDPEEGAMVEATLSDVNEGDGTVELPITVQVDDNRPPGTYTAGGVEYEGRPFSASSRGDTATSPDDYGALSAEVLLPVGSFELAESGFYEASGVVSVVIVDDEAIEESETFNIVAEFAPGGLGVTLPSDQLRIVIADNDGEPPDPPKPPWPPPDYCPTHPDTVADASTPLSVTVGGSVSDDFCGKDDADWVAVDLVAGQAYRIEGTFTSTDRNRPIYIAGMYESDGELITGSHSFDGNPYGTSNTSGYINFRPAETGTHYIEVGDMGWFYFGFATGPLSWDVEVHEIDLPPDDVPGVESLTFEFNNYGYFVDEFEGKINTHGDRDTFAIDVEAGHRYFVEMRNRNGSGIFNCIHGVAWAETPDVPRPNSRECWQRPGWKASRWLGPQADGRYLITIGSDNGTGDYRLRVRDYTAVPPGVWDTRFQRVTCQLAGRPPQPCT
ncbi:cadherin repeat domain-containing protein [Candidatus Poriferisodalis sp.]|uniref:cadherin repeat domain-containing protein n=1 Tax=Candidatus Poriferisodalis sp. TaxID=3101277 RepID=UPI003D0DABC1